MRIAVVILNWNGEDFLRAFLPGVVQTCMEVAHVVVADNASTDGSVQLLQHDFSAVHICRLEQNYGFAEGYNRALSWVQEQLHSEYYVLLNSDVETPEGWLLPLIERLEISPSNAACMPKLLAHHNPSLLEYAGAAGGYIDALGYPFCRGRILATIEEDRGQYDTPVEVHWATGACLAIRAQAYWEAGGLCGGFFAHMEEIDLCWRLRRMGYSIWVEPRASVRHVGGGALPQDSPRKLYLNYRNSLYMLRRNLRPGLRRMLIFFRMCTDGLSAVVYLFKGQFAKFYAVLRAHIDYWKSRRHFPYIQVVRKMVGNTAIPERWKHLMVWHYFLRGRKYYSQLPAMRKDELRDS